MVALSSKISNKAILKLLATALVLSALNVTYYWFNDNFILTGDPHHPHRPPFDNPIIRMIFREIGIWLFYLLNYASLKANGLSSKVRILLVLTVSIDIATILIMGCRIFSQTEFLYFVYNTLIGLLNSSTFFTLLVLLHYISASPEKPN